MKSFQDILIEKMGAEPTRQNINPIDLDPAGLSFLLGQVPRIHFKSNAKYQVPPITVSEPKTRVRREFDSAPIPASVKIRTPGPVHKFSESQKLSFQFFAKSSFALESDFSADELKSAFRKLALIFHPDRGGHEETFISLKFHYDTLKTVFLKNS